jgi:hypothetical protein
VSADFGVTSARLALLYGVPLDNLVPAAELLPPRALQFFYLDPIWINALDGPPVRGDEPWPLAGFVLRSHRVADLRGLKLRAYTADGAELPALRIERPSPDVLLGLFNGELARLTIREAHEDTRGMELDFPREELLRGVPTRRVLQVGELADAVKSALSVHSVEAAREFGFED